MKSAERGFRYLILLLSVFAVFWESAAADKPVVLDYEQLFGGGDIYDMTILEDGTIVTITFGTTYFCKVHPNGATEEVYLTPSADRLAMSANGKIIVGNRYNQGPGDEYFGPLVWRDLTLHAKPSSRVPLPVFPPEVQQPGPIASFRGFSVSNDGVVVGQAVYNKTAPSSGLAAYAFIWFPDETSSRLLPPMPDMPYSGSGTYITPDGRYVVGYNEKTIVGAGEVRSWPARWRITEDRQIIPEPLDKGTFKNAEVIGLSPDLTPFGRVDNKAGCWMDGKPEEIKVWNPFAEDYWYNGVASTMAGSVIGGWAPNGQHSSAALFGWISLDGKTGTYFPDWYKAYTGETFPLEITYFQFSVYAVRKLVEVGDKLYIAIENGLIAIVPKPQNTAVMKWQMY